MLILIFIILSFVVFGKIFLSSIKLTWGITKILFSLILLPIILIGLVVAGFIYLALPILIIVGLIAFFGKLVAGD